MIKILKNYISIEGLTGTCSGFIAHGHVTPQCDKKINSICTYTCSAGYVPDPNNTHIQCLASGAWSKPVDQLCTSKIMLGVSTLSVGAVVFVIVNRYNIFTCQ